MYKPQVLRQRQRRTDTKRSPTIEKSHSQASKQRAREPNDQPTDRLINHHSHAQREKAAAPKVPTSFDIREERERWSPASIVGNSCNARGVRFRPAALRFG
jgi:hypothetical protein